MMFSSNCVAHVACFILLSPITQAMYNWLGEEDYLFMPKSMQEDYLFDSETLKCLVCKAIVWEIEFTIARMDPKKTVVVGSYAYTRHPKMPYARSQEHLHYMVDNICKNMNDYVQARIKSTGEATIIRFKYDGYLNPKVTSVNLVHGRSHSVPDHHLQLKLKLHCESIMEDMEDTITEIFAKEGGNMDTELCYKRSDICKHVDLKKEISKDIIVGDVDHRYEESAQEKELHLRKHLDWPGH